MAMVVMNPTDEEIKVTWSGIDYVFLPDERKRVEDSMGRQVIHNYANRGLISLEYGDEGEIELEKIKAGRAKNDEFWVKQCVNYNQLNEQRQQSHQPFVKPTEQVARHAKRLGIKLLEPYRLEDASSKQISMLMEQNKVLEKEIQKKDGALAGLQSQVSELTENFKKMMALATGKVEEAPAAAPGNGNDKTMDVETVKATVQKMHKKQYVAWLDKNWSEIQTYPDDAIKVLAEKHETLYAKPFPEKRPAVDQYDIS